MENEVLEMVDEQKGWQCLSKLYPVVSDFTSENCLE